MFFWMENIIIQCIIREMIKRKIIIRMKLLGNMQRKKIAVCDKNNYNQTII